MKVRLLQDVLQAGNLKVSLRRTRPAVPFVKGAVIEMSDASAGKYIEQGLAEPYIEPAPAEETP